MVRRLPLVGRPVMESALLIFPVLGAASGYLLDGVVGAASGLLIPVGPLIVAWIFGTERRTPDDRPSRPDV